MSDPLARRAHAFFVRALDVDPAHRAAFVARECAGDAALAGRVRQLVAAVDRASDFLEQPALAAEESDYADPPEISQPILAVPGYRLVRVIGVGGMAAVYEAVQAKPERTVALKVMSRALANTSAVRRFQYETEVLARLQHPGIAQIFEAGTCDDGHGNPLPFFAMEYVGGARTITGYAREHGLSLSERLTLFAEICDAVQHGHQHGVIHRDLKPANILVDRQGRCKVIDFGVARSADAGDAGITRRASVGQVIGTLSSMSPEQCTGSASIDIRSDVYALGVLLYELASDCLPHDLRRASIPEAVRIITEQYPPRLGNLVPAARGDLEAIAMMAMEKEPARRYASAGALAADVRRHLNHQPVDARSGTTLYQIQKFARRHRPLVAAAAMVLATLVVGIVATTRMAYIADRERAVAQERQRELEQVATFQETQLSGINVPAMGDRLRATLRERAKGAAGQSTDDARTIERDLAELDRLIGGVNFTSLALQSLNDSVLERSHAAINTQFTDQPVVRARLLQTLGSTVFTLGLPDRAEPVLTEALQLRRAQLGDDHPDTLQSVHSMGMLLSARGKHDEAYAYLADAYERRVRTLGPEHAATLSSANSLGGVQRHRGQLADAERIWRTTYETRERVLGPDHADTCISLNNVGVIAAMQGRLADAERAWRELLVRRRRSLGPEHPDYRLSLSNLGLLLHDLGKLDEAKPLLEEALASLRRQLGDAHPSTLSTMSSLAALLRDMKDLNGAESLQRECLEGRRRTLGPEHPSTLLSMAGMAAVLVERGDAQGAERILRDALVVQRRVLGDDHAETLDSISTLSELAREAGRLEEAEALAREAVERARRLFPSKHWGTAQHLVVLGRAFTAMGRWADAQSHLLEAHSMLASDRDRSDPRTQAAVRALADLYGAWHRAEPGQDHDLEAERWRGQFTQTDVSDPQ